MDAAQRQRDQERSQAEQARKALISQHERTLNDAGSDARRSRERDEADMKELKSQISSLEKELTKTRDDHIQDLQTAHEEYSSKSSSLEGRLKRAEERAEESNTEAKSLREKFEEEKSGRASVQSELDDLLVVFGDLEAKRSTDKARLKELGEEVSDDDDEEDEDADAEDEEEADGEEEEKDEDDDVD